MEAEQSCYHIYRDYIEIHRNKCFANLGKSYDGLSNENLVEDSIADAKTNGQTRC